MGGEKENVYILKEVIKVCLYLDNFRRYKFYIGYGIIYFYFRGSYIYFVFRINLYNWRYCGGEEVKS